MHRDNLNQKVNPCTADDGRRGRLRHGNPGGDLRSAPRCGATTRRGTACQCPAIRGKQRCRMHGGRSTGPRTLEGRKRLLEARLRHGRYSVIERETAAVVASIRGDLTTRAARTRDWFWRRIYASAAARPMTAEAIDRLRNAVISDRLAANGL